MSLEILLKRKTKIGTIIALTHGKVFWKQRTTGKSFIPFERLSHFCSALAAKSPDWDIFNKWHYDQNLGALPRCTSNKNCVTKWNIFAKYLAQQRLVVWDPLQVKTQEVGWRQKISLKLLAQRKQLKNIISDLFSSKKTLIFSTFKSSKKPF